MSDDKSDLTRIEDLGEFIHENDDDVEAALNHDSETSQATSIDDLDNSDPPAEDNGFDTSATSADNNFLDEAKDEFESPGVSEESNLGDEQLLSANDDYVDVDEVTTYQEDETDNFSEDEADSFSEDEADSFSEDEADSFSEDETDSFSEDEADSFSEDETDNFSADEADSFSENETNNLSEDEANNFLEDETDNYSEVETDNFSQVEENNFSDDDKGPLEENEFSDISEDETNYLVEDDTTNTEVNDEFKHHDENSQNVSGETFDDLTPDQDTVNTQAGEESALEENPLMESNTDSNIDEVDQSENNHLGQAPKPSDVQNTQKNDEKLSEKNKHNQIIDSIKRENLKSVVSQTSEALSSQISSSSPLKTLHKFSQNILPVNVQLGGNPPYSILLEDIKFKDELKEIIETLIQLKILPSEKNNLLEHSYQTRQLLVPQISEYLAIMLANRFKHYHLKIQFGLSEEIFLTKRFSDNPRGLVNTHQIWKNSKKSYNIKNSSIFLLTDEEHTNFEVIKQFNILHASDKLMIKHDTRYQEYKDSLIDFLSDVLKEKARKLNLNAIIQAKVTEEITTIEEIQYLKVSIFGVGALIKEKSLEQTK